MCIQQMLLAITYNSHVNKFHKHKNVLNNQDMAPHISVSLSLKNRLESIQHI